MGISIMKSFITIQQLQRLFGYQHLHSVEGELHHSFHFMRNKSYNDVKFTFPFCLHTFSNSPPAIDTVIRIDQ